MSRSSQKSIKAPYNFVPPAPFVYFPEWHDRVSHDVPFADGYCGKFTLVIDAETPIYTQDDQASRTYEDHEPKPFLNRDGQPFIKGSSIKGMLRNVVTIASFGKMRRADDRHFPFRDVDSSEYKQRIRGVKAGWLMPDQSIAPCKFGRTRLDDLETLQKRRGNNGWHRRLSMPKKYNRWEGPRQLSIPLQKEKNDLIGDVLTEGPTDGTVVFTGPVPTKKREFFFYDTDESRRLDVSDELFQKFEEVHATSQQHSELGASGATPNEHWEFWKKEYENDKRVPIFYITDEATGDVDAFGLAMMFRLPADTTVHEAIDNVSGNHLSDEQFDLAELIFGYAPRRDSLSESLKGRVSITHADYQGDPPDLDELDAVRAALQAPKASFYPAYLQQSSDSHSDLSDWLDGNAKISGWKRYPARGHVDPNPTRTGDDKLDSLFRPLPEGSTFRADVYFHNLRPCELGALVWAIKFGGYFDELVHRLGMGRPHGYGEVSLSIQDFESTANDPEKDDAPTTQDFVDRFEETMERFHRSSWLLSDQISHLLAMANTDYGDSRQLQYEPGPDDGDGFQTAKVNDKSLAQPNGVDQTKSQLRDIEEQRQEERKANMSPVERAELRVDEEIVREQKALDWAREKIHKEQLEDPEKRQALRQVLYDRYFEFWSNGKAKGSNRRVGPGPDKLKEYASWLVPDDGDSGSGGDSGGGDSGKPWTGLPEEEASWIEKIATSDNPKGPFGNLWHNSNEAYKSWSADGLRALDAIIEGVLIGDKAKRNVKSKDLNKLDEVQTFVKERLEKLERSPAEESEPSSLAEETSEVMG